MMKDAWISPNSMQSQQMQSSITDSTDPRSFKSLSESSSKRVSFDYSGCQMHCQLLQKGLLTKKKINMYFHHNKIIISDEAYAKKPKRIIELGFYDLVKWHVHKTETQIVYTGMTIQIRKEKEDRTYEKAEEYEFSGESIILESVKDYLRKYIFQNRLQDEYIIQAQIGKGNYARVFSARHRTSGIKIALKCFEKEKLRKSENGYKSLEKEIKIMQTIGSHPSLLEFIGSYEGENTFYVGMGLIEGNSLYHEIKKRKDEKFPMAKIKMFMKQIISGVHHYQQYGIMHRDLKPENIMFQCNESFDQLVIVDFGLAEFENEKTFLFSKCGTPGYVAPEVTNYKEGEKQKYSIKCDMFSVGVILHTLLYHSSIFYGKKFNEVLQKNKECKIDFTQKLYQDTSVVTMEFMKGLLQKDPQNRFSAQQALDHEFFLDEEDLQIRKKAGSWTGIAPLKIEIENIVSEETENESPRQKRLRKRACSIQHSNIQFKSCIQACTSNGQTQNNECHAINSFTHALSNDQICTSFQYNIHNMFQCNNNMSQSTTKTVNMVDSTQPKLSIEIGSSPYIQPMNGKENPNNNNNCNNNNNNSNNHHGDMASSIEKKQNMKLNRVQEEEEDNESPDITQKMRLHSRDFKLSEQLGQQKKNQDNITQDEKELNNILKLQKESQNNDVCEQNESQEFDNSFNLDDQQVKKIEEKDRQILENTNEKDNNNVDDIK